MMARVKIKQEDFKGFHIRLPRETWRYIKNSATLAECSMTDIVVNCLEIQRKKHLSSLKDEEHEDE